MDRPVIEANTGPAVLAIDIGAPHAVTLTNLALQHHATGAAISVTMSPLASLFVDRIDMKGSPGQGISVLQGLGTLTVQNSLFRGFDSPGGPALSINTGAGFSGSALIRYNSFIGLSPSVSVSLSSGNAYALQLLGNLFFNGGTSALNALALNGDPAAAGNFNAYFGYSSFYGGLTPGANDFPAVQPQFADPGLDDPRYLISSPLAYAGQNLGVMLDALGATRPASGQAQWSIGGCEPISPSPSPSYSRTPTSSSTATPGPPATATETQVVTPTFSPTPTLSLTCTVSPTVTPSLTITLSHTLTQTPTLSPSLSPSYSPTITLSFTQTITVPSATLTATPVPVIPPPDIISVVPVPNPNPVSLGIELKGPADEVLLRLYTTGMTCIGQFRSGPAPAGWSQINIPPELLPQVGGLFYAWVWPRREDDASITRARVKLYYMK